MFSSYFHVAPEKVHTVRCGPLDVYHTFANGSRKEEPNTVLFFGRISKYKGLDYLIHAAPRITAHIPDAKVIIAGAGRLPIELGDEKIFEIHNHHISNEELVNLIQRASVVVAPYTDATHSAVIMTAYSFKKPVVASAVGGIPEVVEDDLTGKLVPPCDSAALSNAVVDLLMDVNKRQTMKRNIAKECTLGKLSWDRIARKTISVYTSAMKSLRRT
jgi:glycosyltransferase involved in cell wall biosynthesis